MTASIKQDLLRLLTRRTQQARENANGDLRELVRIIEVIKQAGKVAECSVQLPTEVTRTLAKRLNRTRLLTYVLAVEECERARKERNAVLRAAEQQLTQEI